MRWAENNLQALIDFGYWATNVVALSGKSIAEKFYTVAPRWSYFVGCSTGGYQGVTEAQRFPWDFYGIVRGRPDIDGAHANTQDIWEGRVRLDSSGNPLLGKEQLSLLPSAEPLE
jgi:feruloyl esterase